MDRDGEPGATLRACLEAAGAAPSVHNSQPWRFRLHGNTVEVLADRTRRLEVLDPTGRELMISVGAAVLNLRVAILAHGRLPVLRLLPEPGDQTVAARIALGPPVPPPDTARLLAQAIPRRHTNRRPFAETPVPPEILDDLARAAEAEGGTVTVAEPAERDAVLSLVRTAEHRRRGDPAYRTELEAWTREVPHRRDGVPPEAVGPWDALEVVPIRDFALVQPARHRRPGRFESEPTIAVLYTAGDAPREWLRAGLALERTLLTATVRGLASTLMTQPLEIPQLRALLADSAGGRIAQAILRFGYGP
ncbi:MAG TPA: nitroreductase family protein, partial [Micromonosporaceae bacterium]